MVVTGNEINLRISTFEIVHLGPFRVVLLIWSETIVFNYENNITNSLMEIIIQKLYTHVGWVDIFF